MPKPYEFIGTIAPHVFPGSAGAVKVLIPKSDMDQASLDPEDFSRQVRASD
jgi:hypothetical protein